MHVCNQLDYYLHYSDNPTAMIGAISSEILPGQNTTKLDLLHKNSSKGATFVFHDVWYIPNCVANLVSHAQLNNAGVYYDNIN